MNTDNRTRGHSFKLVKHRCNCEVRRHFFSERVINRWNMLDQDTISAETVNGFKSKLELERKRKMGLFLDWSLLGLEAVFNFLERPDLWVTCELLPDICQAAGDFYFPACAMCMLWVESVGGKTSAFCARALSTELLRHKTPDFTPDVASQQARPQFCRLLSVNQKQQGMSNIVDELQLLITEWHFINRITHYISQGRIETTIRRGGQLCCSSVANLLQYLCAKSYRN